MRVLRPRSRTVQSHPRSKVIVPIIEQGGFILRFYWPIVVSATVFETFDNVKINPTCSSADMRLSDFHPKTTGNHISRDSTLMASLLKIGGGLRSVERSHRLVWQTDWLTHRQTDFIICPMVLMRWADKKKLIYAHAHKSLSVVPPPQNESTQQIWLNRREMGRLSWTESKLTRVRVYYFRCDWT